MVSKLKACPRCNKNKVIDLGDTIECTLCKLEFLKDDLLNLDPDQILSVQEKLSFVRSIKNNK
jgi:hypothetical protein